MKNKTKKALCAISILGVVAISGIFAYLTDNESKENVFTIGNVDIELLEPSWPTEDLHGDAENDDGPNGIPDAVENLVPNQVVAKDPQVKNVGKNDAYVFLRLQCKQEDVPILNYNPDGSESHGRTTIAYNLVPDMNEGLGPMIEGRDWVVLLSYSGETENGEILVFAYKNALAPGETTPALFDGIKINNISEEFSNLENCLKVEAFAIQADGLPEDIAETIAETAEGMEKIDYNDFGEEDVEAFFAYSNAMGAVYDIIMNQNPDAQPAEFTPYL